MSVSNVAGRLHIPALDGIDKLAQVAGRVRNRLLRTWKIVNSFAAGPDFVTFIVGDQRGVGPLEQAADVPYVFESRERRGPKTEEIQDPRELEHGFQGVGSLGLIGDEEAPSNSGDVLGRFE